MIFRGIPAIRYCKKRDEYVLRVPDMYEAEVLGKDEVGAEEVYISGEDLWRLLKTGIRGDLDDSTYLGIEWIKERYYLSRNTMNEAKRVNRRFSHSQWLILKRIVPRGGRKKKVVEYDERIESMIADYDRIVANCIKHDWANEYVELEREIAKYRGEKVLSRKKILQKFSELRKNNIE